MAKTSSKKGSASKKPVAAKAAASPAKSAAPSPKNSAKPAAKKIAKAVAKTVAPVVKTAAKAVVAAKPAAAKSAVPAKAAAAAKTTVPAGPAAASKPAPSRPTPSKPMPAKVAAAPAKPVIATAAKAAPKRVETARVVEPAYVPPPKPTPVPTDGKPRKNQAGLTSKELESFRDLLLAKRREITGDMHSMESEALRGSGSNLSNLPMHMADMGTDNYEQEFTLGLMEKDRKLLREINSALAKIQDGSYGICEGTGLPISKARLEAQPWAKYSIEYARKMEKGMIR